MTEGQDGSVPTHRREDQPALPPAPVPTPRLGSFLFAATFVVGMLFNLYWDATHTDYEGAKITIFLGSCALLILGVDVGKMIGRR